MRRTPGSRWLGAPGLSMALALGSAGCISQAPPSCPPVVLTFIPLTGDAVNLEVTLGAALPNPDPPIVDGSHVVSVVRGTGSDGSPVDTITFDPAGTKVFGDWTSQHVGDKVVVLANGIVAAAPTVMSAIPDGKVQIDLAGAVDLVCPLPR